MITCGTTKIGREMHWGTFGRGFAGAGDSGNSGIFKMA